MASAAQRTDRPVAPTATAVMVGKAVPAPDMTTGAGDAHSPLLLAAVSITDRCLAFRTILPGHVTAITAPRCASDIHLQGRRKNSMLTGFRRAAFAHCSRHATIVPDGWGQAARPSKSKSEEN